MRSVNVYLKLKLHNAVGESILSYESRFMALALLQKEKPVTVNNIITNITYGSLRQDIDIEEKRWILNTLTFGKLLSYAILPPNYYNNQSQIINAVKSCNMPFTGNYYVPKIATNYG